MREGLAVDQELAAPDMLLQYSLHAPRHGREDVRNFMEGFRAAFPKVQYMGLASKSPSKSSSISTEELMTCNTSAVAVCCSKASRVSVRSRAFSHRDDRLRREAFEQRNLLVGEWTHLLPVDGDRAQQSVVFAQRHRQTTPMPLISTALLKTGEVT